MNLEEANYRRAECCQFCLYSEYGDDYFFPEIFCTKFKRNVYETMVCDKFANQVKVDNENSFNNNSGDDD